VTDGFVPCSVSWCACLALTDGSLCAVHRNYPTLRLQVGWPEFASPKTDCKWCEGSGDCEECNGTGEHSCSCGDEHDCHECNGTGNCQMCSRRRTRKRRDEDDDAATEYLRFAFDAGWRPFDAEAAWLGIS
jgi:hypothetical protein